MRIALFSEVYLPYLNGAVTHLSLLRQTFLEMGHEVLVVTASDVARQTLRDGVLYCPGKNMKAIYDYRVSSFVSLPRVRAVHAFKPDVIHVHNEYGIGYSGVSIAWLYRIPLVYSLHSDYDDYFHYLAVPEPIMQRFFSVYLRRFVRHARIVVSMSPKAEAYIRRTGVKRPFRLLPNAVDTDLYRPRPEDPDQRARLRRDQGLSDEDRAFVFVGRLGVEKSVAELVDIWEHLPSMDRRAVLFVIGKGPEADSLRRKIERGGLSGGIRLIGAVPNAEIRSWLIGMDYYITASLSEMHSISMLEGMAAGLPALVRDDPQNRWQIEPDVNGWIWSGDDDLAEQVRRLLERTPEEEAAQRERCLDWSAAHGKSRQAEDLLDIYRQAIDSMPRRSGQPPAERETLAESSLGSSRRLSRQRSGRRKLSRHPVMPVLRGSDMETVHCLEHMQSHLPRSTDVAGARPNRPTEVDDTESAAVVRI